MASRARKSPPFDRVVEEAVDAVAVVLVVLGGVDAALRGDGVRAAGRILEAEALDLVAQLAQRGGSRGAGEAGADHDDGVLALVRGVDQLDVETGLVPRLLDGAGRCFGVKNHLFHQPQ